MNSRFVPTAIVLAATAVLAAGTAEWPTPRPTTVCGYLVTRGPGILRCAVETPRALLTVVLREYVGLGPDPLPRVAASGVMAAALTGLLGVVVVAPWLRAVGRALPPPPADPDHPPVPWGRVGREAARWAAAAPRRAVMFVWS